MKRHQLLSLLIQLLSISTLIEGCIECRDRQPCCPSIDWRENWIAKEVPIPGIEVNTEINKIEIAIPKVEITSIDIPKVYNVPIQKINPIEVTESVDKIVKIPKYVVKDRVVEQYVDVNNVIEKIVVKSKPVRIPRKVVKVHPVYIPDVRVEKKPRLKVVQRKVPKPVGIPHLVTSVIHQNKTVMVHETTYKFCRNDEGDQKPCPDVPKPCKKCKKCPTCSNSGYKYTPPIASKRLQLPNESDGSYLSEDSYDGEEEEYEQK